MDKKKRKYKLHRGDNMSTLAIERASLKSFVEKNKEKIYGEARQNTKLNEDGKPTISKNDPWFYEDEWDQHFKRMDKK
jgi:hypothetical protein